jgi:hypothetical protein
MSIHEPALTEPTTQTPRNSQIKHQTEPEQAASLFLVVATGVNTPPAVPTVVSAAKEEFMTKESAAETDSHTIRFSPSVVYKTRLITI